MKKILFILFLIIGFSCEKSIDNDNPIQLNCNINHYGTIIINNKSNGELYFKFKYLNYIKILPDNSYEIKNIPSGLIHIMHYYRYYTYDQWGYYTEQPSNFDTINILVNDCLITTKSFD